MPDRIGAAITAVCAAGLAATVVALGVANPPTPRTVGTDVLGPDPGEQVAGYLTRAADSVAAAGPDVRWALVSFDTEVTASGAQALLGDVGASQLWFRVPIDRVQTPIVAVGVAGAASVARAPGYAAARVAGAASTDDRAGRIAAVSASRLAGDCACVVAATVRAPQDDLLALAAGEGVWAVEALPADAVFGRFAVRPLLPGQSGTVAPGPDDGAVPER
ncbi:hypothetical protein ACFWPA_11885 [Rhodococcus sp. NPDC058505]|uniref:hypothetical protein n=1 Tax=unclassified Rhodococcus (in: high G+C Gram-positive bacteria) TaxID=192944 RepID=UPI0036631722